MWAGDKAPGLGALRGTQRPRPEGPQALQVPRGRRDLCVSRGRGAGLHMAFCGFGGSGELEAVPRGPGRPGLGAGRDLRALGEGGAAAPGPGRGCGTPGICLQDTPASATPEPRPRTEAEVPLNPKGSALWAVRPGASQICTQSLSWAGLWLGGPCPGGGPSCDQSGGTL